MFFGVNKLVKELGIPVRTVYDRISRFKIGYIVNGTSRIVFDELEKEYFLKCNDLRSPERRKHPALKGYESTASVALLLDRTTRWIQFICARENIGQRIDPRLVLIDKESLAKIRKIINNAIKRRR